MPPKRYVGRCIYCGSIDDLTDEHIVPRGLNGPWQLLAGSCRVCNQVTSTFERSVLQEQFILPRVKLGLRTYHPKNRPKEFSFEVEKDGHKEKLILPADDCPPIFVMPYLEKPRYIANYDYEKGVYIKGCSLHGSGLVELIANSAIDSFKYTTTFLGNSFERMLAKMAYGMVVLEYGPDVLEECYVLPCILGKKDDAGYWVGSSERDVNNLPVEKVLHRISVLINGEEVHALIRLFADYQTPEYIIIVGKLKH
jgi:hypothetical protein